MRTMKFSSQDKQFMGRVLALAKKGSGHVSPNPMVGAVIVRGGKIISTGYHKKFGEAHAEINALRGVSREQLNGSTLYVNLEPCAHSGKTPPCTGALVKSGIKRIVIAIKDPFPRVSGRGIKILRKAGIQVDIGCMEEPAHELNKKFLHWATTGIPFVGMKVAMSLDGKIATKTGDSKFITSEKSRAYVKCLRDEYDAILVGRGTVLNDNPELAGKRLEPTRVLLDSKLIIPPSAVIFRNNKVIVIATTRAPLAKRRVLEKRGIKLKVFPKSITITPLLKFLGGMGISSLFVEGGSEIFGSFVDARAINQLYWFIAPKIIGGANAMSAVGGSGAETMNKLLEIPHYTVRQIGRDILIEALLCP